MSEDDRAEPQGSARSHRQFVPIGGMPSAKARTREHARAIYLNEKPAVAGNLSQFC
jgi:hypothetical protein